MSITISAGVLPLLRGVQHRTCKFKIPSSYYDSCRIKWRCSTDHQGKDRRRLVVSRGRMNGQFMAFPPTCVKRGKIPCLKRTIAGIEFRRVFFRIWVTRMRIRLFNTGTIRTLAENEFLFKKGTPDKTIYCVLSGTLRVVSRDTDTLMLQVQSRRPLCRDRSFNPGTAGYHPSLRRESSVFCLEHGSVRLAWGRNSKGNS